MKEISSFQTGQLLADTMDVSPCSTETQETSQDQQKGAGTISGLNQ